MSWLRRAISKDNVKGGQNTDSDSKPVGTLGNLSATTTSLKSSHGVPPGNTVSQPNVVPKNILAFRLITKMLRGIPQTQPFVSVDNLRDNDWMSEDRQEVRISNAFAHLAIAEHGTAAIATNRHPSHSTLEGPPNLSVIACTTTLPSVSEGSMKPAPSLISKMWDIMLARNARKGDPPCLYPVIVTPVAPSEFDKLGLKDYMKNLEENW
jgi:hypothetical protein